MEALVNLGIALFLLSLGYGVGRVNEHRHYASIRERERQWVRVPAMTARTVDDPRPVRDSSLVTGSVVVSVDYYKRFLMMLRNLFGGEVHSYSPLIDRGRREALLRMKESAPAADLFVNCRVETSIIASGRGNSLGGIEFLAYGTAIQLEK